MTTNFNISEFKSKDGAYIPIELYPNIQKLAENLQVLRTHLELPIRINSGYRSPAHNAKIKGAKNSYHVKGMAADITVSGMEPSEVYDVIEQLISEGKMIQGGLKAYNSFTHYDVRGFKARW